MRRLKGFYFINEVNKFEFGLLLISAIPKKMYFIILNYISHKDPNKRKKIIIQIAFFKDSFIIIISN